MMSWVPLGENLLFQLMGSTDGPQIRAGKKRSRAKEHGFLKRMANRTGRNVIARRRLKGRAKLTA